MGTVKWVRIQCNHCRARFVPPIAITDRANLEKFIAWGGVVDCVKCHRFVEINRANVPFEENDDSRDAQASQDTQAGASTQRAVVSSDSL